MGHPSMTQDLMLWQVYLEPILILMVIWSLGNTTAYNKWNWDAGIILAKNWERGKISGYNGMD